MLLTARRNFTEIFDFDAVGDRDELMRFSGSVLEENIWGRVWGAMPPKQAPSGEREGVEGVRIQALRGYDVPSLSLIHI